MTRLSRKKHRAAVYGWVKWTPGLLALFAVVFTDIWLNVESRRIGYALSEVNTQITQVVRERDRINVTADTRKNFDRLAKLAGELGLRDATPDQQVNLKVFPEYNDTMIAMASAPVIDAPPLAFDVQAALTAKNDAMADSPLVDPTPPVALDESPEAMLASL